VIRPLPWLLPVVAVAFAAWLLLRDSEEQRILERLEKIRELAEIRAQESTLDRIGRARQLSALFTPVSSYDLTTLDLGVTEISGRDELTRQIAAVRGRLASLELTLLAPAVRIEGDRAAVEITGTALGATHGGVGQFMDVHRVEIGLVREHGEWLVSGGRHIRDEREAFSSE
jgi:hypothetical protein